MNTDSILFTDTNKLAEYNKKLLNDFIAYLNKNHEKNRNIIDCKATAEIIVDEKLIDDFNNSVISNIKKNMS